MKNETKHTPGPWTVDRAPADDRIVVQAGSLTVCVVGDDVPTALSDARLIASAPELLAALQFAVATLTQPVQFSGTVTEGGCAILRGDAAAVVAKARDAIATATGKGDK